jgi:hypothetical protein
MGECEEKCEERGEEEEGGDAGGRKGAGRVWMWMRMRVWGRMWMRMRVWVCEFHGYWEFLSAEGWCVGELKSWRVGGLEGWRVRGLESWSFLVQIFDADYF